MKYCTKRWQHIFTDYANTLFISDAEATTTIKTTKTSCDRMDPIRKPRDSLMGRPRLVLGDTDDTTIYRDTKYHDTSIAEVTILSRY